MNNYGPIVEEAVRLAHAPGEAPDPLEENLEPGDGSAVLISKNNEGAYLAVTLVASSAEAPETLLEALLQITSRTTFGDQLIGGCQPDRRVTLSAIIPLVSADNTEVERRVSHLFTTYRSLIGATGQAEAPAGTGEESTAAGWLRV